MIKNYCLILILWIGIKGELFSQSRFIGILPLQYNPSFAGSADGGRLIIFTGYENCYQDWARKYDHEVSSSYSISYDNFISKLGTGIGGYVAGGMINEKYYDLYRESLKGIKAGIAIAPKLSIKGRYTFSPSVRMEYKSIDFYRQFEREVWYDVKYRGIRTDVFSVSSGLMFNVAKFYVGYTYNFSPLNQTQNMRIFYGERDNWSRFVERPYGVLQTGYKFQKNEESKTVSTIQTVMGGDGLNITYILRHRKIIVGASHYDADYWGYLTPDALCLGYQAKTWRLVYSQNLQDLRQNFKSELSLKIFIPNKSKTLNPF